MHRHHNGWLRQTVLSLITFACILGMSSPPPFLLRGCPPCPWAAARDGTRAGAAASARRSAADENPAELDGITDCSLPAVGNFTMVRDLEIAATFRQKSDDRQAIQGYNVAIGGTTASTLGGRVSVNSGVEWSNATSVDFNGDGKRSVVSVYRDSDD